MARSATRAIAVEPDPSDSPVIGRADARGRGRLFAPVASAAKQHPP